MLIHEVSTRTIHFFWTLLLGQKEKPVFIFSALSLSLSLSLNSLFFEFYQQWPLWNHSHRSLRQLGLALLCVKKTRRLFSSSMRWQRTPTLSRRGFWEKYWVRTLRLSISGGTNSMEQRTVTRSSRKSLWLAMRIFSLISNVSLMVIALRSYPLVPSLSSSPGEFLSCRDYVF